MDYSPEYIAVAIAHYRRFRAAQARSEAKLQAASKDLCGHTRTHQRWTEAEDTAISVPNLTTLEAAVLVGRTYLATKRRRAELGVRSGLWHAIGPKTNAMAPRTSNVVEHGGMGA